MGLTRKDRQKFMADAARLVLGAGAILRKGFARRQAVRFKGRINPVTEYDLKSERFITSQLAKMYPDHGILAEEGSGDGTPAEFRWIIDPLDGTVNYSHGFPVYCASVGLEYRGGMVAGAVFDPEREELFSAGRRLGAFLNGKKIHVTRQTRLQRALLATGFAYNIGTARKNNLGLFARMAKQAQGIRRPGSAAIDLCWLAAGRLDGFWELGLHPWDTAAAWVIVEEAGGEVTRLNGRPFSIFAPDIVAANPSLRRSMQRILTRR